MKLISVKTSLAAVCAFAATSSNAAWYVGFNAGADFVTVAKELQYPNLNRTAISFAQYNSGYTGFKGQILGGYEYKLSVPATLALEAMFEDNAGSSDYTIFNYSSAYGAKASERLNMGWGVFLLPKYRPAPNLALFIGPGYARTQFEAQSGLGTGGNIGLTGVQKSWLGGWGFKLGTQVAVLTCLDINLTYQFMNYGSKWVSRFEPISLAYTQVRYQPKSNAVMLGFSFHTHN